MSKVPPEHFKRALQKAARINFAVSLDEKAEIQQAAKGFGLTTTDYLLGLHRLARAAARKSSGMSKKPPPETKRK
jgi:uncharacterized protein (DUF1778 family)